MKKSQSKPATEKALDVRDNQEIEKIISDNKDDDIENTFCYRLFEEHIFDAHLCEELCSNIEKYKGENKNTKHLMKWIIDCVNQCFSSHHDELDFFKIKNFDKAMEEKWNLKWMQVILRKINS